MGGEAESRLQLPAQWLASDGDRWGASSIEALQSSISREALGRLKFVCQGFEELLKLPKASLDYSFHSLPFYKASRYSALLESVKQAVDFGGDFAGALFDSNDDWVKAERMSGLR